MNDTSKAVEAKYREMLLRLPPQRRFYLAAGMFSDARALVLASLQNHIPPGSTLQCELFKRFYACDFTPEEAAKIIDHLTANTAAGKAECKSETEKVLRPVMS